jgi:hypothetical protein
MTAKSKWQPDDYSPFLHRLIAAAEILGDRGFPIAKTKRFSLSYWQWGVILSMTYKGVEMQFAIGRPPQDVEAEIAQVLPCLEGWNRLSLKEQVRYLEEVIPFELMLPLVDAELEKVFAPADSQGPPPVYLHYIAEPSQTLQ